MLRSWTAKCMSVEIRCNLQDVVVMNVMCVLSELPLEHSQDPQTLSRNEILKPEFNYPDSKFIGPTWGPPRSCRPQMGPMNLVIRVVLLRLSSSFPINTVVGNKHCTLCSDCLTIGWCPSAWGTMETSPKYLAKLLRGPKWVEMAGKTLHDLCVTECHEEIRYFPR